MTRNGFTLVEMLVAVMIFGLISAAGVALLSVSIGTQRSAERKLADVGDIRRATTLLAADLSNAAQRFRRDENGTMRPPFEETPDGLTIVRRGWENPDDAARSSLQRVDYRFADGRMMRGSAQFVDGNRPERSMTLLQGVRGWALRFRAANGEWRTNWDPVNPRDLPRALELILETERYGPIRQLFLVGAGA